ncbi:Hypothetical Protein RSKD131_1203 [Cereibacter sphaeroides KD131]|nr:Hypothetical Protein RSKD131_1203 [Cereibacter sphaeroides KD131]
MRLHSVLPCRGLAPLLKCLLRPGRTRLCASPARLKITVDSGGSVTSADCIRPCRPPGPETTRPDLRRFPPSRISAGGARTSSRPAPRKAEADPPFDQGGEAPVGAFIRGK